MYSYEIAVGDRIVEAFWYLPTQGDERYLGTKIGRREATYPYKLLRSLIV